MNPVLVALDTPDLDKAKSLAASLKGEVGAIKLGLEFFVANGPAGIKAVQDAGAQIFLDLKFHDIPNTVAGAVRSAMQMKPWMLNVHASGGLDMMKAARKAVDEESAKMGIPKPLLIAVTVLTSMDSLDLETVGVHSEASEQVSRLTNLTKEAGLDGVVCSSHEIAMLRKTCGKDFVLVVPGIRPAGSEKGDQKRTMTPKEAMDLGANYLVIGRPITGAADPKKASAEIAKSLR